MKTLLENDGLKRCAWAENDPLYREYHDTEWGVPERDSRRLWETLMLEGFQAGLSWITILRKREAFRRAFQEFDPQRVAQFGEADIARLMGNPGIVRSRSKIVATIQGAQIYEAKRLAGEDFSSFVWGLAGGRPYESDRMEGEPVPAKTALSEEISSVLKKRGFKFVGPVIVYAWMQAVGMVDDHAVECFRHKANARRHANKKRIE